MADPFRFGILGTGNIARQFAEGVARSRRCAITAVGSRTLAGADDFARQHEIAGAHGTYDALLADDSVDAIYVSLPNSLHCEWTVRALEAGKHVLCEKPFAVNQAQAATMFEAADRAGRVLIEAFMYRVHPLTLAYIDELRKGAIGELKLVRCSFNYCTTNIDGNVRFSTDLAGGALMDIGTYCTSLALLVADGAAPAHITAAAHIHDTGIDDIAAGTLTYDSGLIASFTCGMRAHADNTAHLCGTEGFIEIPVPWKPPEQNAEYRLRTMTAPKIDGKPAGPTEQTRTCDAPVPLYGMEADAFADTVIDGVEPFMPREHTMVNQRVLDTMRKQIGLPF